MLCSFSSALRIAAEDVAEIGKFFERSAAEEENERKAATPEKPKKKTDDFKGIVEHDPDGALTDDDEKSAGGDDELTDGSLRPLWNESASDTESGAQTTDEADAARQSWLRSSLISAAPALDVVAMAAVRAVVILERAAGGKAAAAERLQLTAKINVEGGEGAVFITSLLVLPLASSRRTAVSSVDSTAILVGLSDGHVNVYSERGVLIFREHVAYGPVRQLRVGAGANGQLVAALSGSRVALIEAASFYAALKTARVEVARGERSAQAIADEQQLEAHSVDISGLSGARALDIHLLGAECPTVFSQYEAAAYADRPLRQLESTSARLFCSTGRHFAAFGRFDGDGAYRNIVSDAYHHVASRISAAVPSFGVRSFFGFGVSRRDRPQKTFVADSRASYALVHSKLTDSERRYERAAVALNGWPLMAICDDVARVLLVDLQTETVVRVWKGYRSARCAFVESTESTSSGAQRKRALFLVIFAPKRGLLEVWAMQVKEFEKEQEIHECVVQNGPRVAAFNVDRRGRLLSVPTPADGTLLNGTTANAPALPSAGQTAVFLASDGTLFTLNIPFHLAALDVNATQMHDENLLKEARLEKLLESDEPEAKRVEAVARIFGQLKTADCRRRHLERFLQLAARRLNFDSILRAFDLCQQQDGDSSLKAFLIALQRLVRVYARLQHSGGGGEDAMEVDAPDGSYDQLRDLLALSVEEFEELRLGLLLQSERPVHREPLMPLGRFREQFAFDNLANCELELASQAQIDELGRSLFVPLITTAAQSIAAVYAEIFEFLSISATDVLRLFLAAWLHEWNARPWTCVEAAIALLSVVAAELPVHDFQMAVERAFFQSTNARAALFLLFAVRVLEQRARPDGSADFETLDDSLAWQLILSKHLAIQSLLEDLPQHPPVGLERLAARNFAFYRELLGDFVARRRVPLATMQRILDTRTADREETPRADDAPPDRTEILLRAVVEQFGRSFGAPFVYADCAWECAAAWCRDETARSIGRLELGVEFLEQATAQPRLQHGLSFMLWETFVRGPFERLYVRWRDSVDGRMPRDRVLRSEVFCSEHELPRFFACVRRLLRTMQQAVVDWESSPPVEHEYEAFMTGFFANRRLPAAADSTAHGHRRPPVLCELAAQQRPVNYHLALHHAHLATVLELCAHLNLRISTERVFGVVTQRPFFAPFHENPLIPIADVSERLKASRQSFLEDAVEAVGVQMDDEYAERWERIKELCHEWELDEDLLRIKEIVMLHEGRFDPEAQKLYPTVGSRLLFASRLAPVALGRFRSLLDGDAELRKRAERRLKSNGRDAVRQLDDRWAANFEPTQKETLFLAQSVLNLFGNVSQPTAANRDDDRVSYAAIERDRRALGEIRDFLRELAAA
ncbi:Rab3 GTPase-activating protein regulatory subunit [Aphelenchoides fujianensis]|nr:Rab3 GTPase-activating protein regulatory subunit [Aphelenchoides fujianensis]